MEKRIRDVEQTVAVMQHRIHQLEDTPPRVNMLENSVTELQIQVENISTNIGDIKDSGEQLRKDVSGLRLEVRKLFTVGATVAVFASLLVAGVTLYDTWLSINQKTEAKELHNESGRTDKGVSQPQPR